MNKPAVTEDIFSDNTDLITNSDALHSDLQPGLLNEVDTISLLPDPVQTAVIRDASYSRFLLAPIASSVPVDFYSYKQRGGYAALRRVVNTMQPKDVVDEIRRADFLDRDGPGEPIYCKWEAVQHTLAQQIVLVCNVTYFPDNPVEALLIECNPHQLIEGLVIAAYAVGANVALIYVPEAYREYSTNLERALRIATEYKLVGSNILDSGIEINIFLRNGPTFFMAGEGTIPVQVSKARSAKPGLQMNNSAIGGDKSLPTLVHSVETLMNLPVIVREGADLYQSIGSEDCNGPRVVTILGDVKTPAVMEVPCGITIREAIFLAGGLASEHLIKAVVKGGVGGLTLSEDGLDTPILADGNGMLIVLDDRRCLVDFAYRITKFFASQSCGQCRSCKEGSATLASVLHRGMLGYGHSGDLEIIEELASQISDASRCRRGQSGPSIAISAIQNFRPEFRIHLEGRLCPAGACPIEADLEPVEED